MVIAVTDADDDIYLGKEIVPGLAPHAHYSDSAAVTIPGDVIPGEYYVGSYIDPNNTIEESDENDNSHVRNQPLTVE